MQIVPVVAQRRGEAEGVDKPFGHEEMPTRVGELRRGIVGLSR